MGDWEAWMSKSNHGKVAVRKPARKGGTRGTLNGGAARATLTSKKSVLKGAKKSRSASSIVLPDGYRPSENEPFMNERHRAYFRNKLVAWKEEIIRQNRETLLVLHEDSAQHADLADRATSETDRALELRARDRQRKLIAKIDAALARIEEGTYGYCEETGEPIGLKRLDARPIATLSLEAQERHERREKVFRED
jgi:DnaK suppressor protein